MQERPPAQPASKVLLRYRAWDSVYGTTESKARIVDLAIYSIAKHCNSQQKKHYRFGEFESQVRSVVDETTNDRFLECRRIKRRDYFEEIRLDSYPRRGKLLSPA
jgi:hypothetical protein